MRLWEQMNGDTHLHCKPVNNDTFTFYLNQKILASQRPKKKEFEIQTVDFKDRGSQNNYFTPKIIFDTLDASNG